jgi:hypothetical protein
MTFLDDIQYKLDNVKATTVPAADIDKTFRSSCIGKLSRIVARALDWHVRIPRV